MKLRLAVFILFTSLLIYSGCDDSGVIPPLVPAGRINLSPSNLKTLDINTDGWYNLWIGLDSGGARLWFSAGEFNVDASGSPVSLTGNSMTFVYSGDTNALHLATRSMVTIEKQHNNFPSTQRLISGNLSSFSDSLTGTMNIAGDEALGLIGTRLMNSGDGHYMLNSPSTNNANCFQGLWFCDTSGASSLPDSIALPVNGGWVYEGWALDNSTHQYYATGKFFNPHAKDADTSGYCAGPNPGYNAPGQDWIQTGGNCPAQPILLNTGNFSVFVTLEPSNEPSGSASDNAAFFLRLFSQNRIDQTVGCGNQENLFNQKLYYPLGRIRIAK